MPHWSEHAQQTAEADLRDEPPGQAVARCEPLPEREPGLLLWSELEDELPEYEEAELEFATEARVEEPEAEEEDEAELEFVAEMKGEVASDTERQPETRAEHEFPSEVNGEAASKVESVDQASAELEFVGEATSDTESLEGNSSDVDAGGLIFAATAEGGEEATDAENAELEFVAEAPTIQPNAEDPARYATTGTDESEFGLTFNTVPDDVTAEREVAPGELEFAAAQDSDRGNQLSGTGAWTSTTSDATVRGGETGELTSEEHAALMFAAATEAETEAAQESEDGDLVFAATRPDEAVNAAEAGEGEGRGPADVDSELEFVSIPPANGENRAEEEAEASLAFGASGELQNDPGGSDPDEGDNSALSLEFASHSEDDLEDEDAEAEIEFVTGDRPRSPT